MNKIHKMLQKYQFYGEVSYLFFFKNNANNQLPHQKVYAEIFL